MAAGELSFDGTPLYINEIEEYGIQPIVSVGFSVWDCAVVLSKFLETSMKEFPLGFWKGKRVIELGSGTGTVGLAIALLGGTVLLTDSIEVQNLIEKNISINLEGMRKMGGSARVCVLNWNNGAKEYTSYVTGRTSGSEAECITVQNEKPFDFVLCSDVLFQYESIAPFIQTLTDLTTDRGKNTTIYLAHQARYPKVDAEFKQQLRSNFVVIEIPIEEHHPHYRTEKVQIFRIQNGSQVVL